MRTASNTNTDTNGDEGRYRAACEVIRAHHPDAVLPEWVDPLLPEARGIAADAYRANGKNLSAENVLSGGIDDGIVVTTALDALRRGIELGRAE